MPNGIAADQLDDLMRSVLLNYGKPEIRQIAQKLQNYFVSTYFLNNKDNKPTFDGGDGISRRLFLKRSETAEFKGLFAQDTLNLENYSQELKVNYKHIDDGWIYDLGEMRRNKGKGLLYNLIKPREANCMLNIVEKLESKFFGDALSTTDTVNPNGLKYWIVSNATTGFNGGAPGSHTTVGNIDPTAYENWKNFTAQYTKISKEDLIDKMQTAAFYTNFKAPIEVDGVKNPSRNGMVIVTNFATYNAMKSIAENQNDKIGTDLDAYEGKFKFQGNNIIASAQMTQNSDADVYMLNMDTFDMICLEDSYMVRSGPKDLEGVHNGRKVFIDLEMNWVCYDRRANSVIKAAA